MLIPQHDKQNLVLQLSPLGKNDSAFFVTGTLITHGAFAEQVATFFDVLLHGSDRTTSRQCLCGEPGKMLIMFPTTLFAVNRNLLDHWFQKLKKNVFCSKIVNKTLRCLRLPQKIALNF